MELQQQLDLDGRSFIKGVHIGTIFHNEDNLYSVIRVRVEETNEAHIEKDVVVTGYFPLLGEYDTYTFSAHLKNIHALGNNMLSSIFGKSFLKQKRSHSIFIRWHV